jgi:hypothetical protein
MNTKELNRNNIHFSVLKNIKSNSGKKTHEGFENFRTNTEALNNLASTALR